MLRLSEILQASHLGLELVDPTREDPEIVWAHVSELKEPTPWLVGGELVLTTGMTMFGNAAESLQYCQSLVDAGIAALGLSTGASLAHRYIPEDLKDAAREVGLPLVHVPEQTPLQQVVRRVSDALSEQNSQQLERALLAQRQLSEAAASRDGVDSVLRVLDANTGFSSAVYDSTLNLITATSDITQEVFATHHEEIRQHMRQRSHWSISSDDGQHYSSITPLYASKNLRGLIITVKQGPLNQYDQMILSTVFSLLRVLLELRHTATLENRQARGRVADALLHQQLSPTAAAFHLARVGVEADALQCLILPASTTDMQVNSVLSDMGAKDKEILTQRYKNEFVVLICDPAVEIADALAQSVTDLGIAHAGLGSVVSTADARLSLRQARRARALAEERGVGLVAFPRLESYKALLLLGDHVSRSALADAVLSPLEAHGQKHSSSLIELLHTYLNNMGNIEEAAAELGIHRHTMRSRLKKIADLTNRSFKNASDVLELWLACEIRQIEPSLEGRDKTSP